MIAANLGEYVTFCVNQKGDNITQKKLQKLLYYIDAWHLVHFGYPIIEEDFQAWVHGPVLPSLFQELKGAGFNSLIVIADEGSNMEDASQLAQKHGLSSDQVDLIESVLLNYGGLTAFELEILSHSEAPWIEARKGLPPHAPCTNIIRKGRMQQYYSEMLKHSEKES